MQIRLQKQKNQNNPKKIVAPRQSFLTKTYSILLITSKRLSKTNHFRISQSI